MEFRSGNSKTVNTEQSVKPSINPHLGSHHNLFNPNSRKMWRLPPSRQVELFIGSINPFLKHSLQPSQIRFIVNQWHVFRQTQRRSRLQSIQVVARTRGMQVQPNAIPANKEVDLFARVLLRRKASALQKAASFDEFRCILQGAKTQPCSPELLGHSIDLPGVSGGAVFHRSAIHKSKGLLISLKKREDGIRPIRKRSLEETKNPVLGLKAESKPALSDTPISDELSVDEESEDHSDEELREAYNSYNDFLTSACTPKNRTLCSKSLFPQYRNDRSTLFLPPVIYVKRCDNPSWSQTYGAVSMVNMYQAMFNQATRLRSRKALKSLCSAADRLDAVNGGISGKMNSSALADLFYFDHSGSCTCLLPEDECLPMEVRLKVSSVVVYNTAKGTASTELVALTEHVSCKCQRKCENRKCVAPLELYNYTYDDCYCSCLEGDARCEALLDGREKFTEEELPVPLDGSYILPPCHHGPMDEVHLYHRHCPRPDGRIGDISSS